MSSSRFGQVLQLFGTLFVHHAPNMFWHLHQIMEQGIFEGNWISCIIWILYHYEREKENRRGNNKKPEKAAALCRHNLHPPTLEDVNWAEKVSCPVFTLNNSNQSLCFRYNKNLYFKLRIHELITTIKYVNLVVRELCLKICSQR